MPSKSKQMYDNLASLGDSPKKVEKSLHALGLDTLRISRKEARKFLNTALDIAKEQTERQRERLARQEYSQEEIDEYEVPGEQERIQFMLDVLVNNVILGGTFHYTTRDGQVLGCPLTVAFDLPEDTAAEGGQDFPMWGEYFYPKWDEQIAQYMRDHADKIKSAGGLSVGQTALVLTGR